MTTRHFLDDVPLADALAAWEHARREEGCPERTAREEVPLPSALGRVTAAPVWATRSSPPFDAAAMDGIAVRAADTVGASDVSPLVLATGRYTQVDTGDPLPEGADAVVMREHVQWRGDGVELRAAATPFQHVRAVGEDMAATELVLPEGHRLRPVDLAAAAAAGLTTLNVRQRPIVAVLPSGDELVPIGTEPGPGQLVDTNSLMLASQAQEAGCEAVALPICPDDPGKLRAQLRAAAAIADVVLVSAGSSAGRDDHTAKVIESTGRLVVHGVAVKPGHPVVLGVVDQTPIVGVPGYPVSAALTFELFVAPLLDRLRGAPPLRRQTVSARLARKLPSTMGADDIVRIRLGRVRGCLVAAPLARGAGILTSLVRAEGLLWVPASLEGYEAGAEVEIELLRDLQAVERTLVVIGSHDPVLDLLASRIRRDDPGATLASAAVGSLGGLVALRDGLCHAATSHLLDPETGTYTLPYVRRVLPDAEVAVIRIAHRRQGLIVAAGNPLRLEDIEQLGRPGLRYVNRQRGAGTRVLLDHLLSERRIEPAAVQGYEREAYTHLAVAGAIAAGRADCGLGVLAAATAFGLDFVPVTTEPFDLVLHSETLTDPLLAPLLALLADESFKREAEALGGYDTAETGARIA